MSFYLKVAAAVLVAGLLGYYSTAAKAGCPQGACAVRQNVVVQQQYVPQAVIVPQAVVAYDVVPQAVVVQNHAQAVVVQKQRVQRQRVIVRNQRSVQKVVVRH